jgi:hypothetical protein
VIIEIEAKFACDDCGTEFLVPLDPGYSPPDGWAVMGVAEDSVRAGLHYRDGTDGRGGIGSVGEDGRHYCARCTRRRDARTEPNHPCGGK